MDRSHPVGAEDWAQQGGRGVPRPYGELASSGFLESQAAGNALKFVARSSGEISAESDQGGGEEAVGVVLAGEGAELAGVVEQGGRGYSRGEMRGERARRLGGRGAANGQVVLQHLGIDFFTFLGLRRACGVHKAAARRETDERGSRGGWL